MAVDLGDGTTISFGTSAFSANVISVDGIGVTRGTTDTTHLGTTTWKTKILHKLAEAKPMNMTIQFDPNVDIPWTAVAETVTIDPAGSGDTLSFSGGITDTGISIRVGELMQADIEVTPLGALTVTN